MNSRITLVVVSFIVLSGRAISGAGQFSNRYAARDGCIMLQQTAVVEKSGDVKAPTEEKAGLEAVTTFRAYGAPGKSKSIMLGSTDPNSGFKFQLELTSNGAAIAKATFSEFDDLKYKNPQPLAILSPVRLANGSEILSMANTGFVFAQEGQQLPLDKISWKSFDVETAADSSQAARFEAVIKEQKSGEPVIKLIKTYRLAPGGYDLDCSIAVENLSAAEQKVRFNLTGPVGIKKEDVRTDDRKVVGGFITAKGEIVSSRKELMIAFPMTFFSSNIGLKNAVLEYQRALQTGNKAEIEKAKSDLQIGRNLPDNYKQSVFLWEAITNKYFTAILRPVPDEGKNYCDWATDQRSWFYNPDSDSAGSSGDEAVGVDLKTTSIVLSPAGQAGNTKQYRFQLYLGPKDKRLFDKNEQYRKLGFYQTIDFMPCCCCPTAIINPLAFGILAVMEWMYKALAYIGIPNYGIVIIILVFLIRLALHPLTKKSQVSMSKFSKLNNAPEMQEIKRKYADNLAEQRKQVTQFYRDRGVSPASQLTSMLPMMVQMPIWIALYSAIYASIALRGASFLPFWITDLSAPDALFRFSTVTVPLLGKLNSFNLLPILMGVAFYLQQKMTPQQTAANPQAAQQQKMMMIMFPLMFPLMLYNSPSGLNLYIMASTFAGVVEQYVIRKHIREKEEQESVGLVAATSKTGGKVKKKKPKPFYRNF